MPSTIRHAHRRKARIKDEHGRWAGTRTVSVRDHRLRTPGSGGPGAGRGGRRLLGDAAYGIGSASHSFTEAWDGLSYRQHKAVWGIGLGGASTYPAFSSSGWATARSVIGVGAVSLLVLSLLGLSVMTSSKKRKRKLRKAVRSFSITRTRYVEHRGFLVRETRNVTPWAQRSRRTKRQRVERLPRQPGPR